MKAPDNFFDKRRVRDHSNDFNRQRADVLSHLAEASDQGVKMAFFHAVDATEIGNHAIARLAGLVAIGLGDL